MRRLILEPLEDRILYSAEPVATVAAVSEEFINDDFTFEVNFDNAAPVPVGPGDPDNVGYAPFIDVTVQPGITVNGATYLGTDATVTEIGTWNATSGQWVNGDGEAINEHPYGAGLDLPPGNVDGDTWYRVDLPFGSFTPAQPVASVVFDATLDESQGALVAVPLEITAQGGFRFGNDPLNNPDDDPPLQQGAPDIFQITPTVMELHKELIAPEGETATGPNFERQYRLVIDIAQGQTIEDLNVSDLLPDNIVLVGSPTITGGGSYTDNSTLTLGSPSNGNQFDVTFDSVTGTASGEDIVIEFTFYVPEFDADGLPVLDPVTGADSIAFNEAEASGTYLPAVGAPMLVSDSGQPDNEVELQLEALVIQKGAAVVDNGTPGGTLATDYIDYTLEFQVSDYFSIDTLVITDVLSDGQRIDPGTPFTLTLVENGNPLTVDIDPAYIDITLLPDGQQEVVIRLSEFLVDQGLDGTLHGDQYDLDGALGAGTARDAAGDGGTVGTITYRAQILQNFDTTYPSGDQSVDLNDLLSNAVVITGRVGGTTNQVSDDSGTETQIAPWESQKTIYAINGDPNYTDTQIQPNDSVTYRIQITVPAADIENLVITDFLPLPVFNVGDEFAGVTEIDPYTGIPASGTISFGPNNTLVTLPGPDNTFGTADDTQPVVSVDAAGNRLIVTYGTFNDIEQTGAYTIELLYTVTATDRPFADNLLLTNQAVISTGTTNNGPQEQTEIAQITLRQPILELTKGVLDSDSPNEQFFKGIDDPDPTTGPLPGSFTSEQLLENPIDANIGGLDAGDSVTFAVTVMNTGGEDAFDIVLTDVFPAGFVIPSDPADLELTITRGDGTVLTFSGSALDLFGSGLLIDDPGPDTGALAASGDDGSDVLVVTYKLVADQSVVPGGAATNTATLESFAAREGGYDFTTDVDQEDFVDSAGVGFEGLSVAKALTGSDQADTTGNDLTVGEVATFTITVTLPEGTVPADIGTGIGLVVTDDLPVGMEIVPGSVTLVSAGFGGTIADSSGNPLADGATLSDSLVLNFGEIVTEGDNVTGNNAFSITYQVRVVNDAGLGEGDELTNTVSVEPSSDDETSTVVLPDIVVEKDVDASNVDGGDPVEYTIVIRNDGSSTSYDTTFSDVFPDSLNTVALVSAVSSVSGSVAGYFQVSGNTVTQVGSGFTLAVGESITLTVTAEINELETEGLTITNTATATGTSLPGDHPDEEYSDTDSDDAVFSIAVPTLTKEITATSSAGTDGATATIGETVTYDLVITVPEATVPLSLTDAIPAGMSLVSSEIISMSSQIQDADIGVGDGPTSTGANSITFDFGEVTNESDGANTPDTIVVRVVLRVDNLVGNQAEDVLDNVATLDYGSGSVEANAEIDVVEPDLTVTKTAAADADGRDAGDSVTYTITIAHSGDSGSDAYELSFVDDLPPELTGIVLGGADAALFQVSGNQIVFVGAPDLAQGDSIVVTVTGTLVNAVAPGQVIGNEAEITWTSLDGVDADERGGSDGEGGALNDYAASDDVDITIDEVLEITKELVDPAQSTATIGEVVDYRITVELMEGTTSNLVIGDTLPAGMTLVGTEVMVSIDGAAAVPMAVTFNGNDWSLSLPTVVIGGDNVAGNNQVVILYSATVDNVAGNQDAVDLENTASADADDLDEVSDEVTVAVVEPDLQVVKDVSPTTADAGDTVTYTITVSHSDASSADAFDVLLEDLFPAGVTDVTIVSVGTTGGASATIGDFGLDLMDNRHVVTTGDVDIPQGGTVTLTITATVINEIQFGETVNNTAEVTWTSLDGVVAGERDGSGGEAGDPNNYHDDDDAEFTAPQASVTKAVFATSETHTDGSQLTIGETVTYHITVTLPEGGIDELVVTDTLPPGLDLVSYDIVGVLSDPNIAFTAPVGVDTSGPLVFTFENVTNGVGGSNQLVIAVTAVVVNEVVNQAGEDLTNTVELSYIDGDGDEHTDEDSVDVEIVEPTLTVEKSVDQASGQDAGDTVTYTITITNATSATGADAFDLVFSDAIPAKLSGLSLSGADAGLFVLAGNSITLAPGTDLAMGDSLVVTVTGTLTDAVVPGEVIGNEASVTWTSLDGTDANERDGSGGIDDYAASDDVDITLDDSFDLSKALAVGQGASVAVGEEVDYRLTLALVEGTTSGVVITDILPEGMEYVAGSLVVLDAAGGSLAPTSVSYDVPTRTLTVSFDQVVITGDNVTTNDYITLDYQAVVLNVATNQDGTELTNEAEAIALGGLSDEAEDEPTVTVVEPDLEVVKDVSPASGDAGDSVTYTITIRHTGASTADAFDLTLDDLLPADFVPGSNPGDFSFTGAPMGSFTLTGQTVAADGEVDLAQGDEIVITIVGTLGNSVEPGQAIVNEADLTWSSIDDQGGEPTDEERDGTGGEAGDPNNYHDDDDATLTVPQLTIDKQLIATDATHTDGSDVTVGEIVDYRIVVTVPEGFTGRIDVTDLLPVAADGSAMTLVSHELNLTLSDADLAAALLSSGSSDSDGVNGDDQVLYVFTNVGNGVGGSNQIVIDIRAQVTNVAANQDGDELVNTATVDYTDGEGAEQSFSDTVELDLVEPDLEVVKAVSPSGDLDAGDEVTYTVTIQHTGASGADAFDIVFSDAFPAGVNMTAVVVGGTAGATAANFDIDLSTDSIASLPGLHLEQGQTIVLTITGTLEDSIAQNETIGNEASITWSSLEGAVDGERDGSDGEAGDPNDYDASDEAELTTTEVFDLEKALASGQAATATIGETVDYELTLTLIEGTTYGVVVTDDLPAGMAYVTGSVVATIPGYGTVSPTVGYDGDVLTLDFGDVTIPGDNDGGNNTLVITYSAVVQNLVGNQDGTELENAADAVGEDFDGAELSDGDEADDTTTVTVVEPDLEVVKEVSPDSGLDAGDTVTYTITIQHTGDSTADAFDIDFADYFPTGVDVTNVVVGGTSGATAANFNIDLPDDRLTANPGLHLQQGETIVLTVTGVLRDSVQPGETIVNDAIIYWTSLEGDVGGERNGNDGAGGALDEYGHEDDASLTTESLFELEKALASGGSTDVMIGDTVSYELTLHLIEGTTRGPVDADIEDDGIIIADTLPTGMSLVAASVQVYNGTTLLTEGVDYDLATTAQGFTVTMIGNTVIAGDNDTTNDFLRVTYDATVDDVPENEAGDELTNDATAEGVDWDSNELEDSDDLTLTIIEPSVSIDKSVDFATGYDAGDTVTYTVSMTAGGSTAYDLVFSDVLGPEFSGAAADVSITGADAALFSYDENTRTISIVPGTDLAADATLEFTVQVVLVGTVEPNQVINNAASVEWTSLDGDVPGERTDDASDAVDITIDGTFELLKAFADGQAASATIGEQVNYQLTLELIEGVTQDVVITDDLPDGMDFVGTQVMVSIAGGTPYAVAVTAPGPGGQIVIDLGDVTIPADNLPSNNLVVVTYTTVVLNVVDNQSGILLQNTAAATGVDANDDELADEAEDEPELRIVEPALDISKTVSPMTGNAGDPVTYTITISNPSATYGADAFDLVLSDLLPAGFTPGTDPADFTVTGADPTAFTLTGNQLDSDGQVDLAMGAADIVITITGTLNDTVQPGEFVINEATLAWSSLDDQGSAPTDEERDGADGPQGDLDDYAQVSTASLLVDSHFEVEKTLAGGGLTGSATIGESVDYEVTLTLIEGTTHDVVVTDQLPAGMVYDGNGVTITIAGATVAVPAGSITWDAGTGLLVIDLGDVTIPGDNVAGNDTAVLAYTAVVQNVTGNQDGTTLENSVSAEAEDGDGGELGDDSDDNPVITVVEPDLEVVKEVDPASGLDAGDTVTYTITIQHSGASTADAYDIVFSDAFPAGIDVTGVVVIGTAGATAGDFSIDLAGDGITSNAGLHLQQGETIVLTVTGVLRDTVGQNETIVNEASITWSSLEGDVDGERDGGGGEQGDPNDYHDDDDASLTTSETFDLVKGLADGQSATVTIGSTVDYQLTLSLIEGTTYGVVVTDDLPDGMAFVGSSVMVSIGGATPVAVAVTPPAPGGTLTIDLGDVVIAGDNDSGNNSVVITYSTVVQDVADNVRGDELVNAADATGEDANGDELSDGDEPDDETTVTIVEPDLDIVKSVDDATPEPGQVITYTVTVSHNAASDADAMDLLIGDLITDPSLTLVTGSVQLSGSAAGSASVVTGNTTGDNAIQVGLATLAQGDTITITYQVTVAADATIIGDTLNNIATVDYDTIPGEDEPEERDYEESDDEDVVVLSPDLTVVKTVDDATLSPGDTTFYTLVIDNVGAVGSNTATNVIVTDALPPGLTYVSTTGLPLGATASYDAGTHSVTISGFDMEPGDSFDIVINVSVDSPAPAGASIPGSGDDEILTNAASITADNFEPTPEDNEDEVEVTLEADPDLAVTKSANVAQVVNGDQIIYTLTVENLGNQVSTGVVLTDQLDVSLVDFVSASGGGSYDPVSGVVTWTLASLSPDDGPQVFTLTVQVKDTVPAGPNTVDNTTHVEDDGQSGPETNDENNDDDVQVTLIAVPDLVIDKQVDATSAIQGDALSYTITVTNNGLQGATGIVITDDLPNGIKFVSANDGGVYDPVTGNVVWSGISLAAGESVTVTLEVRIPDLYNPGNALNSAGVVDDGANGPDATPENNYDEVVTKIDARYVYNALNGNIFDDEDEEPWGRPWDWRPPLLPIDPIYSGTADPGTQIRLVIYSDRGTELASQFVMADTGGNWLASFPGATIQDRPHEVRVIQDAGINSNGGFLFNFRTYFSPAANPQQFFSEVGGVGGPGTFASSDLLDAMIQGFLHPVFQPNPSLYSYEFLPSSSNTTQYAN